MAVACSQTLYFLFKVRWALVIIVFEKNEKKNKKNICLQATVAVNTGRLPLTSEKWLGYWVENSDAIITCEEYLEYWAEMGHQDPGIVPFFDCRGLFLERPGNFSDHKANFKSKPIRIVAQFLAQKPVSFASFINSFIVSFSKLLKLWSWMKNTKQLSAPEKLPGLSRKGPGEATDRYYMEPRQHRKTPESHVNTSGMPICLYFTFTVLQSTSFYQCKAILNRVNIAIGSFLRM